LGPDCSDVKHDKMMSRDPRLPRAISKWLDVCLRHGRCLPESGRGRKTPREHLSNYIMTADVYVSSSKKRVALSCGTLTVIDMGIEDDVSGMSLENPCTRV